MRPQVRALVIFVSLALVSTTGTPPLIAQDGRALTSNDTVYVTKTGAKYHRASCRSLSRSQIAMSLREASALYGACKTCKPPVLGMPAAATAEADVTAPPVRSAAPAPTSKRCAATTKKGTQCLRTTKAGSAYCWQHAR